MKGGIIASSATLLHLAGVFLKVGFVFFGGGFLLIPVLHRELVVHLHWLTQQEFVDGVAFSQLTPGPVAILATFCGYRHAGPAGAVLATVLVFLPAFALMVLLSHAYGKVQEFPAVRSVMRVLPPAIVGLLLATVLDIGRASLSSTWPVLGTLGALVAIVRFKVNPAILILAGALIGALVGR